MFGKILNLKNTAKIFLLLIIKKSDMIEESW